MRKQFFNLMAVLAVAGFSGCQEASVNADLESGNAVRATISAQALAGVEATKADISDLYYYLEVYSNGELFEDLGCSANGEFSTSLIKGLDYTFVAWADYGMGFYDAAGSQGEANLSAVNINMVAYTINSEYCDAFAGTLDVEKFDGSAISFTLTRPFARVNVATTDITDNMDGFLPTHVKLSYATELYTSYNVITGEVNEDSALVETPIAEFVNATGDISFDYLFSPIEGATVDFTASFIKDGSEISSYTFTNIPYKQNYQTNISGSLLTVDGDITIGVTDDWDGSTDVPAFDEYADYVEISLADIQDGNYPESDYWTITEKTIEAGALTYSYQPFPEMLPDEWYSASYLDIEGRQISIYCPNATSIGNDAFSQAKSLISIVCPNATTIGSGAFWNCWSLTTVELVNATTIGSGAFWNSDALSTVILPNVTTVEEQAFYDCDGLVTLELPEVLTIGDYCFEGANALAELYLPKAISLGESALTSTQLVTLDLPNVESIGAETFYFCDDLLTLSMPKLTSIGGYAFRFCKVLTSLEIATQSTLTDIGESVLADTTPADINLTIGSSNEGVDAEAKTWNGYTFNSITVI